MRKFFMLITYSFDLDYVAIPCDTEQEAIKILNKYLKEEIKTVEDECEYTPSIIHHDNTDIELLYDGYSSDVATYKVIEIGHGMV